MTVVIAIIGTVIAASTVLFTAYIGQQQAADTRGKLAAIQKALLEFRRAHDRLPCPADVTISITAAPTNGRAFGAEALPWGTCYSASALTPSVNITDTLADGNITAVVMGMVPVRTLGLADDFAIDGWGRRIMYAVDATATAPSLTTRIALPDTASTARIVIANLSGTVKSSYALYTLISYGTNGHGGFARVGSTVAITPLLTPPPVNSGSTNEAELVNCSCDSISQVAGGYPAGSNTLIPLVMTGSGYLGGVIGQFNYTGSSYGFTRPTFIQGLPTQDSTNLAETNNFDDIVVYATRADLLGYNE
jgi:type II secretory pathway pseudopilin PulG